MISANKEWEWLDKQLILDAHDRQLSRHGGLYGIRDEGLLASALARPEHLAYYASAESVNAAALAASYAFGIARNHPFVDGNKRTALIALDAFFIINGFELSVSTDECVLIIQKLAAGQIDEVALSEWIRTHKKAFVQP
jgi:death-on-curing protein